MPVTFLKIKPGDQSLKSGLNLTNDWAKLSTKIPLGNYLETLPVYGSITEVHSKEIQLCKPEMTT